MPSFLLDTDHFTLLEHGHALLLQRIASLSGGTMGLSPTTIEEALRGRLKKIAQARSGHERIRSYTLLAGTVRQIQSLEVVAFDAAAEAEYQHLRSFKLRIGEPDLKIGAVALVNRLTLLTRNRQDFVRIPGLLIEDWSV